MDRSKLIKPFRSDFRTQFDSNLEAAHYYASIGWRVFPCNRDKTPGTAHGFKDATTDPERIERWWAEDPNYGIGCATGRESGFFVLDLDLKHDGPQKLVDLLAKYNGGVDFYTRLSKTGSGGYHRFFLYPEGWNVTNSSGSLPLGMDVRGEGGYVILPPSRHPSGSSYQWIRRGDKGVDAIQAAPPWLLEQITRKPKASSEHDDFTTKADDGTIFEIHEGGIDNYLAHLAGSMRHYGFHEDAIYVALVEMLDRIEPGHTHTEADCRRIAHSIASKPTDAGVIRRLHELAEEAEEKTEPEDERERDDFGLVWHTVDEIGQMNIPEPWFLVWPRFGAAMTTIIAGKWKSAGKTTLALSAIRAMQEGKPFLGKPTTTVPVVYLTREVSSSSRRVSGTPISLTPRRT